MNRQSLRCCKNPAKYQIIYETGDDYLVCNSCSLLPYFSRYVVQKKEIINKW